MNKVVDIKTAIDAVKPGDTVLVGGFTNIGAPMNLMYELGKRPEINHLTTVSEDFHYNAEDKPWQGFNPMLLQGQIDHIIVSFFGHKTAQKMMDEGKVKLTLVPQGTLAERLRAAGAGLGGFYTPTGVGTVAEEGKEVREINGRKYVLEMPLPGDVALVKCWKADRMGNAIFNYTAQNFNFAMATAGKTVILECEELVEPGEIRPDEVQLPGVFVDYVVHCPMARF